MWKIRSPLEKWKCTETDCILSISSSVKEFAMSLSALVKVQRTCRAENQICLLRRNEMGEFISAEAIDCQGHPAKSGYCLSFSPSLIACLDSCGASI